MDFRYGSQAVFTIEYRVAWVTTYRYKVLRANVGQRVCELVCQACAAFEIRIINGVVRADHAHVHVSALLDVAPSEVMRRIKEHNASTPLEEFPALKKRSCGRDFSARGYFLRRRRADDR